MAIDQKFTNLINADIDGEISDADKAELLAFLADSTEGRTLYEELSMLCSKLESIEDATPPDHMRYVIMNAVKPMHARPSFLSSLRTLVAAPALRYATVFAAGVALTLSLANSGQITNNAFSDVAGLVGTVANPTDTKLESSIAITETEVAGTVYLRSRGPLLVLDFDLVTKGPIDIEANYIDPSIWFNGFAQLESSGTTISAGTGRVTLRMDGKRRYAVYLHNEGSRDITINLQFFSAGRVVHKASLDYSPAK